MTRKKSALLVIVFAVVAVSALCLVISLRDNEPYNRFFDEEWSDITFNRSDLSRKDFIPVIKRHKDIFLNEKQYVSDCCSRVTFVRLTVTAKDRKRILALRHSEWSLWDPDTTQAITPWMKIATGGISDAGFFYQLLIGKCMANDAPGGATEIADRIEAENPDYWSDLSSNLPKQCFLRFVQILPSFKNMMGDGNYDRYVAFLCDYVKKKGNDFTSENFDCITGKMESHINQQL